MLVILYVIQGYYIYSYIGYYKLFYPKYNN